jgi:hypothetical protein
LEVEAVSNFKQVYASLSLPKDRGLIIQHSIDSSVFSLVDVSSNNPEITDLIVPDMICSELLTEGVVHSFVMKNWDDSGRYLLVKHIYGDDNEWLVIDSQNLVLSKNISTMFNIEISEINFSGTSGNNFFIIQAGDIRKLDLADGTMSKVLASNARALFVYDTNIVVFVGEAADDMVGDAIGLYRDGDDGSYIIKNIFNEDNLPVKVATVHYFNQDYIAYSVGQAVYLVGGRYPNSFEDSLTALVPIAEFNSDGDILDLGFSPTGQYVFAQSNSSIFSFDIEYQTTNSSVIDPSGLQPSAKWLNENYILSNYDGDLTIREFDGNNVSIINSVVAGQAVVLTHNGRYLYSIGRTDIGYQLQRVRMIIP